MAKTTQVQVQRNHIKEPSMEVIYEKNTTKNENKLLDEDRLPPRKESIEILSITQSAILTSTTNT